jgi:phosphoribosyl-ATP pyrophosphohydrolase
MSFTLSDLEAIVASRAAVTDGTSWTAKLVAKGIDLSRPRSSARKRSKP